MAKVTEKSFWKEGSGAPSVADKDEFLFNYSSEIAKIVKNMSKDPSIDLETIAQIIFNHDYTKNFNKNFSDMLNQIRLENYVDYFLGALDYVSKDVNVMNTFNKPVNEDKKGKVLKDVLLHLPNVEQMDEFIAICDHFSDNIITEMFMSLDLKNSVERFYAKNIFDSNGFDNIIVDVFKDQLTEPTNSNRMSHMYRLMEINKDFPNVNIFERLLDGKNNTQLFFLFEDLSKEENNLRFLDVLPKEYQTRYINFLIKNHRLSINGDFDQLTQVIQTASPNTRDRIIRSLSDEDKEKLEQHMTSKIEDARAPFTSTVERVDTIREEMNDINTIKANIKDDKDTIKNIRKDIKKIQKKISKDEKKLMRMAEFPDALDRIGFIENIRLKRFLKASAAHEEHIQNLEEANDELTAAEERIKEEKESLRMAKASIKAQRDAMREQIKKYKEQKRNAVELEELKELLSQEKKEKRDKVGKINNNSKIRQAWAYIVQAHNNGVNYHNINIQEIITNNKEALGILDEDQLKNLIGKIQRGLKTKINIYDSDEKLEEEIQRSAGFGSMGMSNYALIIAVTALTVTGLIILLTMILS